MNKKFKSNVISFRIDNDLREYLIRYAKLDHRTIGEYIRLSILEKINNDLLKYQEKEEK